MIRFLSWLLALGSAASIQLSARPAWAKGAQSMFPGFPGGSEAASAGHEELTNAYADGPWRIMSGWGDLMDGWGTLDTLIVFILAAGLGAIIAYHPRTRSKASTIEELEQPKTFIMYALVGALTSLIVKMNPNMSLVVFGIGGLMRFRTDVGPAKDTGRVLLTAIVGVAVGLKMIPVAILATAFGWVLLFFLERDTYSRIMVQGVDRTLLGPAADAYRKTLIHSGCRVLGEKKNFVKGQIIFIVTAPHTLDRETFERLFGVHIPENLRGSVDWDVS